jgi:hypothetical protein
MTKNYHQLSKAESTDASFEKQKQLRDEFYRFVYALALRDQFAMLPDERAGEVLLELFKDSLTLSRIRTSIDFAFLRFHLLWRARKALDGILKFARSLSKAMADATK